MADVVAAANTRIEKLADAIENVAIGLITKTINTTASPNSISPLAIKFVDDARAELRSSLRDFLQPLLRIVEPRQGYQPDTPESEMPLCLECQRHFVCADRLCPHWRAALKVNANRVIEDNSGDVA